MKRFVALLTVLVLAVGLMSACSGDGKDNSDTSSVSSPGDIFSTENVKFLDSSGKSVYTIIRPDGDEEMTSVAAVMFKNMKKTLNTNIKNSMDTAVDGTDAYEILLGNTNRPESKQALDWLKTNVGGRIDDYIICTIGKKIVINAPTKDGVEAAAQYFLDNFVKAEGVNGGIKCTYKTEGDFKEITINGESIGKFKFVRPHFNATYLAQVETEKLAADIASSTGYLVDIVEDDYVAEGDFEISVGLTNRSGVAAMSDYDAYEIRISGKKIYINGGTPHATAMAVSEFNKLLASKTALTDADSITGSYSANLANYDLSTTWRPVWGDEFDGDEVDTDRWYIQPKTANGREGQNGKFSGMDPDAVFVKEGKLVIAAHENDEGYWGGEIITQNKMTYKYGYIEYSCITPDGDGFWSLLWLCGAGAGYARPEIDVNECFGNAAATAANCHAWPTTAGTNEMGWEHTSLDGHNGKYSAKKYYCPDGKHFGQDFHTFGFLWDEDEMSFTADGKIFFSYTTNTTEQDIDAFVDDPMYVRIGMSFGRANNNLKVENLTDWERENTNKFIVDWVHLYRMDNGVGEFNIH